MTVQVKRYKTLLSCLALGFIGLSLAGCSSSNESTTDLIDGVFIDSAVQGLSYSSRTQSGVTDENGAFTADRGEPVIFSIGDLTLPAVLAKETITPLDIFSATSTDNRSVVNLARLLQSLDTDNNPENGIVIDSEAANVATQLDFSSETFDADVANFVANSGSQTVTLIDAVAAVQHLEATLNINQVDTGACGDDHPLVGQIVSLSTLQHQVAGDVRVVDNCTLEVTDFVYDGQGPRVFFFGALDSQYSSADSFVIGPRLNGRPYNGETLTLTLPDGMTLDDMNSISVWCADFRIDFGSAVFN